MKGLYNNIKVIYYAECRVYVPEGTCTKITGGSVAMVKPAKK